MAGVTGNLFLEVGLVVIAASIAAYLLRLIRQPQILAYVLVGLLITPILGLVTDTSIIESMSIIGIEFLLFIVGLEMDIKSLRSVALVSTAGALIEMIVVFTAGFILSIFLGFSTAAAITIGLALSFSSTMVAMKLLSDKRELTTLHGRIAVGTLLTQDVVAVFALIFFSSAGAVTLSSLGISILKFIFIIAVAFLGAKYVFPKIFSFAAKNQELLLITSVGVCFAFALGFAYLELSIAIGAFVAGIMLGNLPYEFEIVGRVKSLKDFFTLLFFVSLGMIVKPSVIITYGGLLLALLFVALIIKPFVILLTCSLFRYTKKPSFLTANSLAQIGEFSLILVTQALAINYITQDLFSVIVIVTLISITLTPYYIQHSEWFYKMFKPFLQIFDRFTPEGLEYAPTKQKQSIILCGHNRIGYSILKKLDRSKDKVLIVDYNPEMIDELARNGYHCIYGDVGDEEIIAKMNLEQINLFISTIPSKKETFHLLHRLRSVNKKARVIVTASQVKDALKFYEKGADYVLLPHFLGGEHVAQLIGAVRSRKIRLKQARKDHIDHLKERKSLGHEHPSDL